MELPSKPKVETWSEVRTRKKLATAPTLDPKTMCGSAGGAFGCMLPKNHGGDHSSQPIDTERHVWPEGWGKPGFDYAKWLSEQLVNAP